MQKIALEEIVLKKVTASILAAAVALSMTAVGVLPASAAETASVERIFVSTDSTMNASIPANLAFDGDNTTRWGTGHLAKEADSDVPTDPLYIGVDFGESGATFDKITVDWENSYSAPYENGGFVLQYSKNGTSWTDFPASGMSSVTDSAQLPSGVRRRDIGQLEEPVTARFVRVLVLKFKSTSAGADNISIYEMQIFNTDESADTNLAVAPEGAEIYVGIPEVEVAKGTPQRIIVNDSRIYNDNLKHQCAFDGKMDTRWGATGLDVDTENPITIGQYTLYPFVTPIYIGLDFGDEKVTFDKITVDWEAAAAHSYLLGGFVVQYSDTGADDDWTAIPRTCYSSTGYDRSKTPARSDTLLLDLPVTARYVRVVCLVPIHQALNSPSIWEMQMFNTTVSDTENLALVKDGISVEKITDEGTGPDDNNPPQTGVEFFDVVWLAVLVAAAVTVLCVVFIPKRHRVQR